MSVPLPNPNPTPPGDTGVCDQLKADRQNITSQIVGWEARLPTASSGSGPGSKTDIEQTIALLQQELASTNAAIAENGCDLTPVPTGCRQVFNTPAHGQIVLANSLCEKWRSMTPDQQRAMGNPTGPTQFGTNLINVQEFDFGVMIDAEGEFGGPHVVYGPLYQAYMKRGGYSGAAIGLPTADVEEEGDGCQLGRFVNADLAYRSDLGMHSVSGAFRDLWNKVGGVGGKLGYPIEEQIGTADGMGQRLLFTAGAIYSTPTTQIHEIHGPIYDRWKALGDIKSYLGYPTSDVEPWTEPGTGNSGWNSTFQNGQIHILNAPATALAGTPATVAIDVPDSFSRNDVIVTTPAGTALGGWVNFTIRADGSYSILYHMHDSGLPGYDFVIRAVFVADNGIAIASQHSGHVGGTVTPGDRDDIFTDDQTSPLVQANWASFQNGTPWITRDYSVTGVIGFIQDLASIFSTVVSGAAGLAIGVIIGVGSEIDVVFGKLGAGGTLGVIAGVVVCVCGGCIILAVAVGVAVGAVTDAMIRHRYLTTAETTFADAVFSGTIDYSRVIITNLSNPINGHPFTFEGIDKKIYVNLADDEAYDSPTTYGPGSGGTYLTAGEVLIHELTHAWQILNGSWFTPSQTCAGIVRGAQHSLGSDVYAYGPPGNLWTDFNVEAQAAIVDQWFGCVATVNAPLRTSITGPTKTDPYYSYIRDNIRKGMD